MAGTYTLGERKIRPGAYFRIEKKEKDAEYIMNGVTAVVFRADFGPLNKVVTLDIESGDNYADIYGSALTTDAIREAIAGGAKTLIACRLGNGGTQGSVTLKDADDGDAVSITTKYPSAKEFFVTIREKLSNTAIKQCIFYSGTTELEKFEFDAGENEAEGLAAAIASSRAFDVKVSEGKENAILANVSQSPFTAGTDPTVNVEDYSNAFALLEAFEFNTICVDTEDTAVHSLLQMFVRRIFEAGSFAQAVVAEKHTTDLDKRMEHAAAFNDEKMNYVLNAYINKQGQEIDGYQTAARIAGMIGAVACNKSLTHTVIEGFTELMENLTNTEMSLAETKGCLVLSYNKDKKIWIDNAINTLITPADNQDAGWKKIRRVKTRFELLRRANNAADELIGKVDNLPNGRKTVINHIQDVCMAMVEEEKLVSGDVTENSSSVSDGDEAYFDIDIVDMDSIEHMYLTFRFQFSSNV